MHYSRIKGHGEKICLCTGADEETAQRYAQALGIEQVYAGCVPSSMEGKQSKTARILDLRKKGHKVAMIGDAGNDTPAIKLSDLGIAVESYGSDEVTREAAGIVIHTGTLLPVASAFAISKQTVSNINQNLTMSLLYNLSSILVSGGLLVALGVTINPVVGVSLMILQACMILMNVYRFKEQPLEHLEEATKQYHEASSPSESSHSKIHKLTPACQEDYSFDQSPPIHPKPRPNKSAYSFWDSCFGKENNDVELGPRQTNLSEPVYK